MGEAMTFMREAGSIGMALGVLLITVVVLHRLIIRPVLTAFVQVTENCRQASSNNHSAAVENNAAAEKNLLSAQLNTSATQATQRMMDRLLDKLAN